MNYYNYIIIPILFLRFLIAASSAQLHEEDKINAKQ